MTLSVLQVIGNVALGGAERHLLDLASGLQAHGVTVQAICPRPGPLSRELTAHGVPTTCIEMVYPQPGDAYGLNWQVVEQLTTFLRVRRPDVVHSHLYPAHLHASLAAHEAGIPAILQTAHTLVVRLGDVLLARLARVQTIAVARSVAALHQEAGVPAQRLAVVYNGVGDEHFTPPLEAPARLRSELNLPSGPVIGTVARLSQEKGLDVLLRAVQLVRQQTGVVTFVIAGDGPEAANLRTQAAALEVLPSVRFLGPRTDIARLNRLFDLFVLPSREEACSMALLEAMAAGRAVVATRVGGNAEVVEHGVSGLLVPANDPQALATAIVALLGDPARAHALGAAARARVWERFRSETMVAETLQLYGAAAEQRW
jgi:glycosyltransferase involved in cell wall biosynthesis